MLYLKINGFVLEKIKSKENDALVYILTKNYGMMKCLLRGVFQAKSKNLTLSEPGNYNRFFILTDLRKFQIISALPLKIPGNIAKRHPYIFLWTLKIIKNLNLLQTPKFLWFILIHLENYLKQNPKNFPYWFLYHLYRELGYEVNLDNCSSCLRKLKNFAYFNRKRNLFCYYCKKDSYQKIKKDELQKAKKIRNLVKIPEEIPQFLKAILFYNLANERKNLE
jgi:recombinational DNA repair protein (RecF pathway)